MVQTSPFLPSNAQPGYTNPYLEQFGPALTAAQQPPPPMPAPAPATAPTSTKSGDSGLGQIVNASIASSYPPSNQDLIANQALNSIFNQQPGQIDMSQFANFGGGGSVPSFTMPSFGGGGSTNVSVSPISTTSGFINPNQFNTMSGATASVPGIISPDQVQQAIGYLLNRPSVFDQTSGGPIVDEIRARTNAAQEAFTNQRMQDLERGLGLSRSGLAAEGVLSGSDVLRMDNELIDNVINDINVFSSGLGLEQTKYLGDLAMRDIDSRSNNMMQVLIQAQVQRGVDANIAISNADRISREVMAGEEIKLQAQVANLQSQTQREIANLESITQAKIATADINARLQLGQLEAATQANIASLNAQTQMSIARMDNARALALGQLQAGTQLQLGEMGAGVDVLQLLSQDFANQQNNLLNTGQLPLNLIGGLTGPLSQSSGSMSSK